MEDLIIVRDDVDNLTYVNSDIVEPLYYATSPNFDKEKVKIAFIKKVESFVRRAPEYTRLIKYLREELEIDRCSILDNVSTSDALIEWHHAPLTLFDITEILLNRRIDLGIPITTLSLAEEVILLHYKGLVGLIPLTKTMHDLVHSNKMKVPKNEVIGNVKLFYDEYKQFFDDDDVIKCDEFFNSNESETTEHLFLDKETKKVVQDKKLFVNSLLSKQVAIGASNDN